MDPLGVTVGIVIAVGLASVSTYFLWRQAGTLHRLRMDPRLPHEQRVYLTKQGWRRMCGAILLLVLAFMLFGSVFLDYDPQQMSPENLPQVDEATAKQSLRFLTFYLMTMLLILMAILTLAVLDFWAIARFGVQQQKQLAQEHQELLAAELAAHKHRQSEPEA